MCIFIPSVDLTIPQQFHIFACLFITFRGIDQVMLLRLFNIHSKRKWQTWFYYSMRLFYYSMRLFYYSMRLFYYSMRLFYYSMTLFYYSMRLFYYSMRLFYYSMRLFYYSMRLFYYSMRLFYYSMRLFYYSMTLFYYSMTLFYYSIFHSPLSIFLRLLGTVASDLPIGDANNSLITRTRYYVRDDSSWIFTDCKRIVNVVCGQQKPQSGSTNPVHPLCRICPTCKK